MDSTQASKVTDWLLAIATAASAFVLFGFAADPVAACCEKDNERAAASAVFVPARDRERSRATQAASNPAATSESVP